MPRLARIPLALLPLWLCGCERAPFYMMDAGGREAGRLATLGWWVLGTVSLAMIVMGVLIVWGALRKRGTLDEHLAIDVDGGKAWIVVGGLIIPGIVLVTFFFATLGTLRAMPTRFENPDVKIHVTGNQWWWKIDYLDDEPVNEFSLANEIHVPVGGKVQVELTSSDVIHSFWVPKLFGKVDAIPGHTNYLTFVVDSPGVYWGECAEYCGLQHSHMRFAVVAQNPETYRRWLERQRSPAVTPSTPELTSGRNAFEENACGFCHRVRGTRALGTVAPDLTHFGSRLSIGAGRVPNVRGQLQGWIADAQAIKPGIRMPTLATFDGETLNSLAAYLESLK